MLGLSSWEINTQQLEVAALAPAQEHGGAARWALNPEIASVPMSHHLDDACRGSGAQGMLPLPLLPACRSMRPRLMIANLVGMS